MNRLDHVEGYISGNSVNQRRLKTMENVWKWTMEMDNGNKVLHYRSNILSLLGQQLHIYMQSFNRIEKCIRCLVFIINIMMHKYHMSFVISSTPNSNKLTFFRNKFKIA